MAPGRENIQAAASLLLQRDERFSDYFCWLPTDSEIGPQS